MNDPNQLDSIMMDDFPHKLSCYVGDSLDVTGLTVEGSYLNRKKKIIEVNETKGTGFGSSKFQRGQVHTVTVDGQIIVVVGDAAVNAAVRNEQKVLIE